VAFLKRLFFRHDGGMGGDWYFLARDTETRQVFILHEWSHRVGDNYDPGSAEYELETFLSRKGTAQDKLRELIGTLASD
jgi:hypothetical protein